MWDQIDHKLKELLSIIGVNLNDDAHGSLDRIRKRIQNGKNRRKKSIVEKIFEEHSSTQNEKKVLAREKFAEALAALDLQFSPSEIEELFDTHDVDSNKTIDFDEFESAVRARSHVAGWVSSLPIRAMLVDALRDPLQSKIGSDSSKNYLKVVSELTDAEIELAVKGFSEGLRDMLCESVKDLKAAFDKKVEKRALEAKDSNVGKFEMKSMECGKLEDFHKGIEEIIGAPHLEFRKAMEKEHCSRAGFNHIFTAPNYGITTTPKEEWEIVLGERELPKTDPPLDRRIPDLADLLDHPTTKLADLTEAEIISMVLYTGPMYHIYNTILRKKPEDLYEVFAKNEEKAKEGNLFSTTIFVLGSAVQKMSRVTCLPKGQRLYRGLGGDVLFPKSFYKNDKNGCTGFTEWGFMSTTAKKEVAIKYSGLLQNKPMPSMLVIEAGAVDRGACIMDYSQFKKEEEYLWVPASFVEHDRPRYLEVTKKGIVDMYPVRVNANLRTSTTDELIQRKKKMHLDAFKHSIHEIEVSLRQDAENDDFESRMKNDRTRGTEHTVENFLRKILEQCNIVWKRHDQKELNHYTDDNLFRSLVLEMMEVKVTALSKLQEYWRNVHSSFITYRFDVELRTVHRRYIAFLQRTVDTENNEVAMTKSIAWCRMKGLIASSITELNDLQETRLMVAAAEGRSDTDLHFLVRAGANVNEGRGKDQVTSLWLAAQFGHTHCIRALIRLKAIVNQASGNGATPLYIAAQSGFHECVELLAAFGADVNAADNVGMTPAHEAAMNGNKHCIDSLATLRADLNVKNNGGKTPLDLAGENEHTECVKMLQGLLNCKVANGTSTGGRKLIISSGDISDVDGFLALAEYIKTKSDVMFVMNYPAYVAETASDDQYEKDHPGLGYKYTAKEVIDAIQAPPAEKDKEGFVQRYKDFLKRYDGPELSEGGRMKKAMTDIAFFMAKKLWSEISPEERGTGKLLFCIGGVNAVNPFSAKAIKNEIGVYAPVLTDEELEMIPKLDVTEGAIYDLNGSRVCDVKSADFGEYSEVMLDFNGSMAFFDESWREMMSGRIGDRLKGVFIMGGVYSEATPLTMPAIPGKLNRFSSATMNQLYHPENAARLFKFLARKSGVPVYTVANNSIHDLATFSDPEKQIKTFEGVGDFLKSNGIKYEFLSRIARAHYESAYSPPRKAFDFYTAVAMAHFMEHKGPVKEIPSAKPMTLFFCEEYGLTLISPRDQSWDDALKSYVDKIDTKVQESDNEFIRTKKQYFLKEIGIIRTVKLPFYLNVSDVQFSLDDKTKKLHIK